ncbi:MAG: response regulator, partial [Bacteroidota bacterium]
MTFDNAQILLAEDNPTNQMVATTMLEKMKCRVTPAGNGVEAIKLMKQRQFDLIFMDCNMPEMDGFEATKLIRGLEEREGFSKTPIIAFTAYAMKGDDQRCLDAGMDDYIAKPVKKQEMIKVMKKWLPDFIQQKQEEQD